MIAFVATVLICAVAGPPCDMEHRSQVANVMELPGNFKSAALCGLHAQAYAAQLGGIPATFAVRIYCVPKAEDRA